MKERLVKQKPIGENKIRRSLNVAIFTGFLNGTYFRDGTPQIPKEKLKFPSRGSITFNGKP